MHDEAAEQPIAPDERRSAHPAPPFRAGEAVGLFFRGVGMGAADVVPGVSGGTIAFITGIYERFIFALKSLSAAPLVALFRAGPKGAFDAILRIHWATLIPLGLGIVVAIVGLSKVVLSLMETRQGATYAAFFGLIAASAWIPLAKMKRFSKRDGVALALAGIGAFLIVGFTSDAAGLVRTADPAGATHVLSLAEVRSGADAELVDTLNDGETLVLFDPEVLIGGGGERLLILESEAALEAFVTDHDGAIALLEPAPIHLAYVLVCGVIAISAMVLPGLSGSFLLLLMGVYHVIFGALHRVVDEAKALIGSSPDPLIALSTRTVLDDASIVGVFLVGVAIGLATFSRLVSWLFDHAHDVTMAALTGLMIGALRLPFMEVVTDPKRDDGAGYWATVTIIALVAAAIVMGLHAIEVRRDRAAQ